MLGDLLITVVPRRGDLVYLETVLMFLCEATGVEVQHMAALAPLTTPEGVVQLGKLVVVQFLLGDLSPHPIHLDLHLLDVLGPPRILYVQGSNRVVIAL